MQKGNPIAVVGGGTMGLAIALELSGRGHTVQVHESGSTSARRPGQASYAAAGMLAPDDPDRPPALRSLGQESLRLYDDFLHRIEAVSGLRVPYQTTDAIEYTADGSSHLLRERSIDPRQLHEALTVSAVAAGVRFRFGVDVAAPLEGFAAVIFAAGAWQRIASLAGAIRPRKGQMLRVKIPDGLALNKVHRAQDIYIVPRTTGPQRGSALIGATVEDCGFDTEVEPSTLAALRQRAARLIPDLGDAAAAPELESWAGLRPATPDALPLIGRVPGQGGQWVAAGHFRDGILLAPVTAAAVADMVEGREPAIDLSLFDPGRFAQADR